MFPYANELTSFETDRLRELLQKVGILNIRDHIIGEKLQLNALVQRNVVGIDFWQYKVEVE